MKTKLFDVILHPRLEINWIHFDIEATDQDKKTYTHRSVGFGGYAPPYPAFPCGAGKNHFTKENRHGYTLDPLDINQIIERLGSYEWEAGLKSIKFSNQVYVCPKTYIVWQSANEKIEGTNYFEVKELPKNKNGFYHCREQDYDVYKLFHKENL